MHRGTSNPDTSYLFLEYRMLTNTWIRNAMREVVMRCDSIHNTLLRQHLCPSRVAPCRTEEKGSDVASKFGNWKLKTNDDDGEEEIIGEEKKFADEIRTWNSPEEEQQRL